MESSEKVKSSKTPDEKRRGAESLMAGAVRSAVHSLRLFGYSSAAVGTMVRKQAFLSIGSQAGDRQSAILPQGHRQALPWLSSNARYAVAFRNFSALVNSTLQGYAAFGIYESLITQHRRKVNTTNQATSNGDLFQVHLTNSTNDAITPPRKQRSPLPVHFAAGALAGMLQSFVMDSWEVLVYWATRQEKVGLAQTLRQSINQQVVFRRMMNGTVGHTILFGGYECFRRVILDGCFRFLTSGEDAAAASVLLLWQYGLVVERQDGMYDLSSVPIMASFLAGGFAGQAQTLYSRMTSVPSSNSKATVSSPSFLRLWRGFLPAALAFAVFEHGADFATRYIDDDEPFDSFSLRMDSL